MAGLDKVTPTAEMLKYINAIRNSDKRDYATRYAIWLMRGEDKQGIVEPVPFHLTYMGAQAVRMKLNQLAKPSELAIFGDSVNAPSASQR